MVDPENEAAAAARKAKRRNSKIPNVVKGGQPIGECHCGERFDYGAHTGANVSNMDPCPGCGSRDWHKWGYRYNGEEIRRDEAWDRYDEPPSVQSGEDCNERSRDTGTERPECPDCGSERTIDYLSYPDAPLFANTSSGAYESVRKRRCWDCGSRWRASEDNADWSMSTDTDLPDE